MLMTDPSELSRTLKYIKPTHVAVAYLGNAWQKYLTDLDTLEEIIVSPTIGSYPGALEELLDQAERHGFKVFFSEKLHAKLFIGKNSCLIGSPNLSHNGFGGGLNEAAVHLTEDQYIQKACTIFETLKLQTVVCQDLQREIITKLWKKWQRIQRFDVRPNEAGSRNYANLANWHHGTERIILTWGFHGVRPEFNKPKVKLNIPEAGDDPGAFFPRYLDFAANDDIQEGDWLLYWITKTDGKPDRRSHGYVEWIQVDKVIPDGAIADENGYSTMVVTMPFGEKEPPKPPFILDDMTRKLIHQMLETGDYKALKPNGDQTWRYKDVNEENKYFFNCLQKIYRYELGYKET